MAYDDWQRDVEKFFPRSVGRSGTPEEVTKYTDLMAGGKTGTEVENLIKQDFTSTPTTPPAPTLKDVEPYEYTPYELKPPEITPTPAPEYKAPDPYMPGANATVKGQLSGLLSPGSSYIQSAQQRAKEALAPRGLLNTTMMGTAGERAAIEAALPIAQQDAGAFQEAGMLGYQGKIAGATSAQKHGQDVNLVGEQAKYSSLLSAQTAEQDAVTAAKKAKENEKLLVLGGDIDAVAAAKKAVVDSEAAAKQATLDRELLEEKGRQDAAIETLRQESATARQEAEIAFNKEMGNLELTTKEKDTASRLLADLGDSFSRQIGTVQSDPNLDAEAKTSIIAQLRAEYEQNVKSVADIYGIEIDWLTGEESDTGGGTGETGEGGTGAGGTGGTPGVDTGGEKPKLTRTETQTFITYPSGEKVAMVNYAPPATSGLYGRYFIIPQSVPKGDAFTTGDLVALLDSNRAFELDPNNNYQIKE